MRVSALADDFTCLEIVPVLGTMRRDAKFLGSRPPSIGFTLQFDRMGWRLEAIVPFRVRVICDTCDARPLSFWLYESYPTMMAATK